jgi:hypothetical protein
MGPDLLHTYDAQYAAARARVTEALSGTDDRPSAVLLDRIDRAFRDGEVCFPETETHGPYVHLGSNARDPETPALFLAEIRANGHGEEVVEGHRVTRFCPDLDAFIAAFEAREREYDALAKSFLEEGPEP